MNETTRRQALGSMMLTAGAFSLSGWPAQARSASVAIPPVPMRLTRRVERSLDDGKSVIVERSWKVRFARQGRAIALTGEQIDVLVEAPSVLAPLAEIERARTTEDMWPILLSSDGLIQSAGTYTRDEDLEKITREAERIIAERPGPKPDPAAVRQDIARMQAASGSLLERLPGDLFYPGLEPQVSRREIALPGGIKGEFEVRYEAKAVKARGWLDQAERHVTTRIGRQHAAQGVRVLEPG